MKQQKEALFHDGSSQFCKYNEKSDTYTFILRTTIGAVNQAFMAIDGYEMKMSHVDTKGRFDYYAINLALGTKMIKYHFRTLVNTGYTIMFSVQVNIFLKNGSLSLHRDLKHLIGLRAL